MSNPNSPYYSSPTPAPGAQQIAAFRGEHRFLSNFFPVPGGVRFEALVGPTIEHVFQAAKTFDTAARSRVLAAATAVESKQIGRHVPLREDWELVKLGVMARLQASKYSRPDLAQLLLATADAELVEGNHWCDTFWGVCSCRVHERVGQNWLGRILMIQRSVLRG